jgi:hypothetical protein
LLLSKTPQNTRKAYTRAIKIRRNFEYWRILDKQRKGEPRDNGVLENAASELEISHISGMHGCENPTGTNNNKK